MLAPFRSDAESGFMAEFGRACAPRRPFLGFGDVDRCWVRVRFRARLKIAGEAMFQVVSGVYIVSWVSVTLCFVFSKHWEELSVVWAINILKSASRMLLHCVVAAV